MYCKYLIIYTFYTQRKEMCLDITTFKSDPSNLVILVCKHVFYIAD
jgi:hypothetical protein